MYDSTAAYMNAIACAPTLSKEEEKHLIKMAQKGDEKAKSKFIEANLRFMVKIVLGFPNVRQNKNIELLDLFQECNIKLLRALEKFNLGKGYKFSTYAVWWIKNAIFETLSTNYKIKIPRYVTTAVNRYYREVNQILAMDGIMPSMKTITEKIKIPIEKMRKFLKLFQEAQTVSMDDGIAGSIKDRWNKGSDSYCLFDKKIPCPEKLVQTKQLNKKLREMLLILTPKEEKVLRMRSGVGEKKDHTLEETGNAFGVTRERIRQIEAGALRKLREKFVIGFKTSFQLNDYL